MTTLPVVLTIAGSDSCAGAGIQADLKTFSALSTYGVCAITAITAQNTCGVDTCFSVPTTILAQQIESLCTDFTIAAVKIGMLDNEEAVSLVVEIIKKYRLKNIVLDPVIRSSSGTVLLPKPALEQLKTELIPHIDLITPNLSEAQELNGGPHIVDRNMAAHTADALLQLGARAVLLKGGHLPGKEAMDILATGRTLHEFSAPKIEGINMHGTGCTLSSAIAAHLALGFTLIEAVDRSKQYLTRRLQASQNMQLGKGSLLLNHLD